MATETAFLPNPLSVRMIWLVCCNAKCGVAFGMAEHVYNKRQEDGEWFYCTNGHTQHFTELETTRLKRRLESTENALRYAREDLTQAHKREDRAKKQVAAQKGVVTKLKTRAHAGVCAHCNRTFENYARHMKTKHPEEKA